MPINVKTNCHDQQESYRWDYHGNISNANMKPLLPYRVDKFSGFYKRTFCTVTWSVVTA